MDEEIIITPQQSLEESNAAPANDNAIAIGNESQPSVDNEAAEEAFVGDVQAVDADAADDDKLVEEANDMDEEQVMPDEIESSRSNICASRSADSHCNNNDDNVNVDNNHHIDSSDAASTKLQELMLQRIESIDVIRGLVEKELEQDSALIAEFTEQVVALERDLSHKENQVDALVIAKDEMQLELTDLKLKSESYNEEHAALTAQINALFDQNSTLEQQNAELLQIKQSIEPTIQRNEQMEEIITSITSSLKDCKRALERELKYAAALEKEKERTMAHNAKLAEGHQSEILAYKKRLEESHQAQIQLRKEMDELRSQLCQEQLINTKMTTVQNNLNAAEQSIVRLNAEKQVLVEEVAKVSREKEEMELKMEKRVDPVKVLQKELETLRKKMGEMQMENTQLIGLQGE